MIVNYYTSFVKNILRHLIYQKNYVSIIVDSKYFSEAMKYNEIYI